MSYKSMAAFIVWYLIILWIVYGFVWGTAGDKAFNISYRISKVAPAFFSSPRMQKKERFIVVTKVFAIIFFVFNTLILVLVLSRQ